MRRWEAGQLARAAGARLLDGAPATGPVRVTIDSRDAGPGALFVGLRGERLDGGEFAADALADGCWGVLVADAHAARIAAPGPARPGAEQAVIAADDPLLALQRLAGAWRAELRRAGARVIGVTGSTGKTSTKDLLLAILAPHRRVLASDANLNTEIGLPLQILAAEIGTELLVLEMAMRGLGQIAELCAIAAPDVGVIVSVGPVHVELLGSLAAIAAAKAELIAALPAGGTVVIPADEPLLEPHLRAELRILRFGPGGDVRMTSEQTDCVEIDLAGEPITLALDFTAAHLRRNLLAAVAAAAAVGVTPGGRVELRLTPGRGGHIPLPGGITLIDGSYNANPMSMRASLEELAATAAAPEGPARRVAVLGDMLELGPDARAYHEQLSALADASADLLVTVGPLAAAIGSRFGGEHVHVDDAEAAAALVPTLLRDGDVVLVKGSFAVGLRAVCEALAAGAPA